MSHPFMPRETAQHFAHDGGMTSLLAVLVVVTREWVAGMIPQDEYVKVCRMWREEIAKRAPRSADPSSSRPAHPADPLSCQGLVRNRGTGAQKRNPSSVSPNRSTEPSFSPTTLCAGVTPMAADGSAPCVALAPAVLCGWCREDPAFAARWAGVCPRCASWAAFMREAPPSITHDADLVDALWDGDLIEDEDEDDIGLDQISEWVRAADAGAFDFNAGEAMRRRHRHEAEVAERSERQWGGR